MEERMERTSDTAAGRPGRIRAFI